METYTITKDDLKAMRTADTLSWHSSFKGGACVDSGFVCGRQPLRGDPYGEQLRYEIPVPSEITFGIGGNSDGPIHCFACCLSAKYSDEIVTILSHLRAGDELTLSWYADAWTNGYAEKHALHGDRLTLWVRRKDAKRRAAYLLDHSFCEDNTARMIRGIRVEYSLAV